MVSHADKEFSYFAPKPHKNIHYINTYLTSEHTLQIVDLTLFSSLLVNEMISLLVNVGLSTKWNPFTNAKKFKLERDVEIWVMNRLSVFDEKMTFERQ